MLLDLLKDVVLDVEKDTVFHFLDLKVSDYLRLLFTVVFADLMEVLLSFELHLFKFLKFDLPALLLQPLLLFSGIVVNDAFSLMPLGFQDVFNHVLNLLFRFFFKVLHLVDLSNPHLLLRLCERSVIHALFEDIVAILAKTVGDLYLDILV